MVCPFLKQIALEIGGVVMTIARRDFGLAGDSATSEAAAQRAEREASSADTVRTHLSGLHPMEHARLTEEELAAKFPEVVQTNANTQEAAEVTRQALKATNACVDNELLASGGTVNEPPAPVESKAWA